MAIYLDHNAGSPLRPEVKVALEDFLRQGAGNPASVHRAGQNARRALEEARARVATLIGAHSRQVTFTSGGTEANNAAIFGAVEAPTERRRIISSAIEHSSVIEPLKRLERRGFEVVWVAPDGEGRINPGDVFAAITPVTALVTLGLANAEVGTIQELAGLADPIRRSGAIFHVDAAQAVGRIPVSVDCIGCDLMTLSGHKLGAPAGIGALFVRDPNRLGSLMVGGPQERGLRPGTPNLAGAIGFGAAAAAVAARLESEAAQMEQMSERLLSRLGGAIAGLRLNGPLRGRLPNTLNLTFPTVLGETMLIALDLEGVQVSMGSACAAGAVEPSHVLRAMGRSAIEARSSLRLSLGSSNTSTEVDQAAEIITRVWRRVAETEPLAAGAAP